MIAPVCIQFSEFTVAVVLSVDQGDHLVAEPKPGHFRKPIPYLRNMLSNIKFTQYAYNGLLCIVQIFLCQRQSLSRREAYTSV